MSVTVNRDLPFRDFATQGLHYMNREHVGIPTAPVNIPASWKGVDLKDEDFIWHFTPEQITDLERCHDEYQKNNKELAALSAADFSVPSLASFIEEWREALMNGTGVIVAKGLPVEKWGYDKSAMIYWGLGHLLGKPGAQNPDEELLGHVKDYGEDDPNVRLYRTSAHIQFHCDAADVVGLLCLEPSASGGASRLASSVAVFNAILERDPNVAARLFEPMRMDRRGEEKPGAKPWGLLIPSCYDGEVLRTFWHSDYFSSVARHEDVELTETEKKLIEWFEEIGNDPEYRLDMNFEAGDIQFISNHTVIHARTAYEDGDTSRHLLRLWLSFE